MEQQRCRVSFQDGCGIHHATDTAATSAYGAVVEAMVNFFRNGLAGRLPGTATEITVTVTPATVEHKFTLQQVLDGLSKKGGTEDERANRGDLARRLRKILADDRERAMARVRVRPINVPPPSADGRR